ncbi:DUF6282 family protein [Patulibacter sp. SYSU D01012]|uniref:DUF6282 family protein n=1 Tax=Patulibacter sp. SYSU D01012 TaxID=2817381 RepID=UPI001B307AD7|nr:DUF6282 family protein [Patulibacter sp. SYSU D01012]
MTRVDELLQGAVDLHTHPFPSGFPRQVSIDELARQYADAGFAAFVAKDHHHQTASDVLALERAGVLPGGIVVHGGVALNGAVGGLNPRAVDIAIQMGARMVWLPTTGAANHLEQARAAAAKGGRLNFPTSTRTLMPEEPLSALDAEGRVRPELRRIIELVAEAGDVILASGHLAADEVVATFELAHELGVRRMLVTHPNFVLGMTHEQGRHLAGLGVVMEHSICMYDEASTFHQWPLDVLVGWIEAIGPEHTSLGSDLGQNDNPLPLQSWRTVCGRLLDAGVPESTVRAIAVDTPTRLLNGAA